MNGPLDYTSLPGHYDEMVGPDGAVRPHWQPLSTALAAFGRHELHRRTQEARKIIRDNGMTFHVHKGTGTEERPWPLDLIPCVIDGAEWAMLESAIVQRATLLDTVLADLYGPQRLLRERTLPAEWLHAHPAFLRACHGLRPSGGRWLNLYAADLVRSPDGRWWVLGDRTEAPAGIGFALENRIVVNSVLSDLLLASKIRRLAGTFENRKRTLEAIAPGHGEHPHIVVMTPGPAADNYFEHAFLARSMGYTLVEGTDLTVRNDRVFIKTLGGLQPVDLILRSHQSDACDPLEFTSQTGVPGLVEAVRRGSVGVVNTLGSGVADSPALMAFMPALCRQLFGADLLLPSVATWWCGGPGARAHVLDNLDRLVIKPAYPRGRRERTFGRRLPERQRNRLAGRIARQPHRYVAQEQVALSTTPVRTAGGLAPRFFVIRVFAVARSDGYDVLPGGLGRVSASTDSLDVTLLGGGSSKDVWIVGGTEEPHRPLRSPSVEPIDVSRATFDLPSRIADNLYWLGRYAERVEAAVRLLRAAVPLLSEESSRRSTDALTGALSFLTELAYVSKEIGESEQPPERKLETALSSMLSDTKQRGSVGWQVDHLRNAAWRLRDRLSADSWRIISRLEPDLQDNDRRWGHSRVLRMLDQMMMILSSFGGAVSEGMTRGHGWRLLDMGRRLERALQVIQLLRHGLTGVLDDERARIELLLDATGSVITYRSRYLTSLRASLVVDLLLLDDANPRGVAFQLDHLKRHVKQLPETPAPGRRSPESRLVTDAIAAIQLVDLDELCAERNGRRPRLTALLDRLQNDLGGLSDAITRDYLTHVAPIRHLGGGLKQADPVVIAEPTFRVAHTTRYSYAEPVSLSMHQVRLQPRVTASQQVRDTRLLIDPPASASHTREDYYGNVATSFTVARAHHQLRVTAASLVTKLGRQGGRLLSPTLAETAELLRRRDTDGDLAAVEYQMESPLAPRGAAYARYGDASLAPDRPLLDGVEALMRRIHEEFEYDAVATTVATPVAEVLEGRRGVCQDFAHLMLACLRSHDIPARYVSGYLLPGPGVVGAQASHAWVSVYCPAVGWVDFDPTNNVVPSHGHITLAWGRDYEDVTPFKGVAVGGGAHTVEVSVSVTPTSEGPMTSPADGGIGD